MWQHLFADAVTTIQEGFPEAYSGSAIEDSGVWVSFAGKAPQGALDVLTKLPADVEVRQDAGWTEVDIRAMGEEIHHSTRALEGVADVSTSIDTNLGRIAVVTEVEAGTPAAAVRTESLAVASSVEDHRADTARSDLEGIAVEVTAVKADAGGFDALYGGAKLTTSSGGYCTAGFSVGSASYSQGLMTAAHCSNSLSYGSKALTYRGGSSTRDVQWHSGGGTTAAKFYVGTTTLKTITSYHNPTSGTTVCKYGRKTGGSCDRVSTLNQCRGQYCGLTSVLLRQAAPGDSGGPWYYGNAGYGIHSGYITLSGARRDVFTPLRSAASTLGVTVKTS
ncbi:hypothetical protein J4G33_15370 [Actinotalea sp. BY-33]|uniref:S1 family peptidase n=1 Tax=Actinotalea soli TaxID=2819234 RepID=A0A939LRG2_9CELL|nr:S1 family peptidase [Actinotalea soli]MBO1753186.1 hypothetical protein [Actinotalea soli]